MKLSPAQKRALQIVAEDGVRLVYRWGGAYWIWRGSNQLPTQIRWETFRVLRERELVYLSTPTTNAYRSSEGGWAITEAGRQALAEVD